MGKSSSPIKTNYKIDQTDKGILRLLQQDARLTHKEIAARVNKSVTPIHVRIRRLEDEGYIKRYTAVIDPLKIGKGLIGFTQIQLKEHSQESILAFQREVVKLGEVMECYHMTGAFDFLLKIAIEDINEYNDLLMEKLSRLPHVGNLQSFFAMSVAKNETAFLI